MNVSDAEFDLDFMDFDNMVNFLKKLVYTISQ